MHDILNPWLVWYCCRMSILLSLSISGSIVAHCDGVHTQPEAVVVGVTVEVAVVVWWCVVCSVVAAVAGSVENHTTRSKMSQMVVRNYPSSLWVHVAV